MKRTITLPYAFLLGFAFGFLSCGLPKTIFLSQPGFSSTGAHQFVLTHNIDNYDSSEGVNQSFKGYEIFYRAYDSDLAAQNAVISLQSNKSIYEDNPNQFMSTAEALGFVRMKEDETSVKPLISINTPASSSTATLEINTTSDWVISSTDPNPDESFFVVRNITEATRRNFYKNANFLSLDTADYTGASNPSTIYFVFFAVAYGEDPEAIGQWVYSLPDDMIASLAPTGNIISFP